MKVRELLDKLGQTLTVCHSDDTIQVGAAILTSRRIGALPVYDESDSLVGIISERDIVHAFVHSGCGLQGMRVGEVMSTNVICCGPDDSLEKARSLLRTHRIRHLPVVEENMVMGILSIRDLLDSGVEGARREFSSVQDNVIPAPPN